MKDLRQYVGLAVQEAGAVESEAPLIIPLVVGFRCSRTPTMFCRFSTYLARSRPFSEGGDTRPLVAAEGDTRPREFDTLDDEGE
jgi:hypothetical protein